MSVNNAESLIGSGFYTNGMRQNCGYVFENAYLSTKVSRDIIGGCYGIGIISVVEFHFMRGVGKVFIVACIVWGSLIKHVSICSSLPTNISIV